MIELEKIGITLLSLLMKTSRHFYLDTNLLTIGKAFYIA